MNPTRKRIVSPDRPTFNDVANLLSVSGVSVMAGSPTTLVHVVGQVSAKTAIILLDMGAEIVDI